MTRENYVGIDVGKKSLDLAVYGSKKTTTFPNTEEGIEKFLLASRR